MSSQVPYLKQMLTSPVDTSLQSQQQHPAMPSVLTRPPGVENLEEWGKLRIPSGKHPGKTFAEIYENDRAYTRQMWNRKAVSSWTRSREKSIENQERETKEQGLQMPISPHMTPEVQELIAAGGAPWLSPHTNAKLIAAKAKSKSTARPSTPRSEIKEESEWQKIGVEEKTNKRGYPTSSIPSMEIQPNEDRVRELTTKIAVLQRELQLETQGKHSPGEDA
jgi:hypothetical protein